MNKMLLPLVVFATTLASCGQQNVATSQEVEFSQKTNQETIFTSEKKIGLIVKPAGFLNSSGEKITKFEADIDRKSNLSPQSDNFPIGLAGEAKVSMRAYPFSANAYGRVEIDCAQPGGRFEAIAYATARATDPNGNFADGYKTSMSTNHAEVLSGAVNKVTGSQRYVVQGTLQASYAVPYGPNTMTRYELETRPLEAVYTNF